jgi:hypothetical protein
VWVAIVVAKQQLLLLLLLLLLLQPLLLFLLLAVFFLLLLHQGFCGSTLRVKSTDIGQFAGIVHVRTQRKVAGPEVLVRNERFSTDDAAVGRPDLEAYVAVARVLIQSVSFARGCCHRSRRI